MEFKTPEANNGSHSEASLIRNDLSASIVVFLVTLPLCLGVALASGAPLMSGIISGIVGGIVVGSLSGSHTSVTGPAAGLAAVVLSLITMLGSLELFFCAVIIAGTMQIALGLLKAGALANYIPSNVIKGMLAAIGIILILKQIPHALGYDIDAEEDFSFRQSDGENTFSELVKMFDGITPGALVISIVSLLILVLWERSPLRRLKFFRPSVVVVLVGVLLNLLFSHYVPYLDIGVPHLVQIPEIDFSQLSGFLYVPSLDYFRNYQVFLAALTIALVGSLETLMNIEAIDKLDPHKRQSPPNRELMAQGTGNIVAGFLGGIPVTSVIVRSSVNVHAGSVSRLSTILHGCWVFLSVVLLTRYLNQIPLSALASVLIITGFKLANMGQMKAMYRKGWNQFIPFALTILAIIFTDLLIGVLLGLAGSIFFLMASKYQNPFKTDKVKLHIGEILKLELSSQVSFFNKAAIKDKLWQLPNRSKVIIDATRSDFVDSDVLEIIEDFKNAVAPERHIQVNILGLKPIYKMPDQVQFVNVLDRQTQQNLSPIQVLNLLKEGNDRFLSGKRSEKYYRHQLNATSNQQNPMAVIVSCMDSRATPEIIFDAGIGDLLVLRIAGNIIDTAIVASIELAVSKMGVKLVMVMAHSNCGAVSAAIHKLSEGNLNVITSKIDSAIAKCTHGRPIVTAADVQLVKEITIQNARNSISDIMESSEQLKSSLRIGELQIAAGYYDTSSGKVSFEQL